MGLKEKILEDLKTAMKAQEAERLSAIRFLQSAVKNREIELRPNSIDDAEILGVIKKLVKQRQDSIEQFTNAGRTDLADKEKFELKIMESYLPAQMSKEQLGQLIDDIIKSTGANSIKQMGAVMKEVQARTGGAADNRQASELIKARLQG